LNYASACFDIDIRAEVYYGLLDSSGADIWDFLQADLLISCIDIVCADTFFSHH